MVQGRKKFGRSMVSVLSILSVVFASVVTVMTPTTAGATTYSAPTITNCTESGGQPGTGGLYKAVVDSQYPIDIWTCGNSATAIHQAMLADATVKKFYEDETALMGTPIPSTGSAADGGDTNIDLYLVSGPAQQIVRWDPKSGKKITASLSTATGATALAVAYPTDRSTSTTVSSGFMLLKSGDVGTGTFDSLFVHEFFHILQYRTNSGYCTGAPGIPGLSEWWFTEASATWAQSYFDPNDAQNLVYSRFTNSFETHPSLTLLTNTSDASPPTIHPHGYSSFIWPYFMQQQLGAPSIAQVWTSMSGKATCSSMNDAVNTVLPFDTNFKTFALRNLDTPLLNPNGGTTNWPQNFGPKYSDLQPLFPEALPTMAAPNMANKPYQIPQTPGKGTYPYKVTVPTDLQPLSSQYNSYYLLPSWVGDVQLNFTGLSNPSSLDVTVVGAEVSVAQTQFRVVDLTGTKAGICFATDTDSPYMASGISNGGGLVVIVDDHSMTTPVSGTYTLTARADCASSVSGATSYGFTETSTTPTTGTTVTTDKQTEKISIMDARTGFDGSKSMGTDSSKAVETQSECVTTTLLSGSGALSGVSLSAFNAPASLHGPYLFWLGGIRVSGSLGSSCGGAQSITGSSFPGFLCYQHPTTSYGAGETILNLSCAYTEGTAENGVSFTGGGTLTATNVDPCGIWTETCKAPWTVPNGG